VTEHRNVAAYAGLLHTRPGDIVYDIGANSGETTKAFAAVAGHVYAFEPNAEIIAALSSNQSPNVTIINKAVSDDCAFAPFHLAERAEWGAVASSLMRLNGLEKKTRTITVETITIDSFSAQTKTIPNLVKIDVEGCGSAPIEACREADGVHDCPLTAVRLGRFFWLLPPR
jgi:FkbM family methyltransferase